MPTRIFLAVFFLCCITGFVKQCNYLRTPEQLRNSILANLRYDTCGAGTVMQYINNDQALYTYYFASDSVVANGGTQIMVRNNENKTAAVGESVLAGIAAAGFGDRTTSGPNSATRLVGGACEILSGYFLGAQIANFTHPGRTSKKIRAILADKKNWPDLHRQYVRGLVSYTYVIAQDIKDPAAREQLTRGLSEDVGNEKVLLGYLDYTIVRDRMHATALATGQPEEKVINRTKTKATILNTCGTLASLALLGFVMLRYKKTQKAKKEPGITLVSAEPRLQ